MKKRDRLLQAWQETGVGGLARRALRNGLARSEASMARAGQWVSQVEFERRIDEENRATLQQNTMLRDRHRGERAFVVGNGPSLRQQDLEPLADELTFCVNAFYRHPITDSWSPTYYLVTDGLTFEDSPGAHAFFEGVRALDSTFFAPLDHRQTVVRLGLLPEDRTHYVALNGFLSDTPLEDVDLTRVLPSPNTVVQTAIMAALYMGFSEIVLLGCDHNWLDDPATAGHFYEGKTADHLADNDENELLSNYYALLTYVRDLWQGYRHLQRVANHRGATIINATAGGRLDLFERRELVELLGE